MIGIEEDKGMKIVWRKSFNIKSILGNPNNRVHIVLYSFTLLLAIVAKLFYSISETSQLLFLLSPVTWLVSVFTGMSFQLDTVAGYVHAATGIVIGKSCSGMNFFIMLFCMSVISFIHLLKTNRGKLAYLAVSLAGSYMVSILATAFRIIVSIRFFTLGEYYPFLQSGTAHKITGIVIYLTSLVTLYYLQEYYISRHNQRNAHEKNMAQEETVCNP